MLTIDDRLELVDLVYRYAHAVDALDVTRVAACFAPDARLEFASTGIVVNGRDEIASFFEQALGGASIGTASTHLMGNTTVTSAVASTDGTPIHAELLTSAVVYHATRPVGGDTDAHVGQIAQLVGQVVVRGVTYVDRCARPNGRWLLADRIHRLNWQGAMPGAPGTVEPITIEPITVE